MATYLVHTKKVPALKIQLPRELLPHDFPSWSDSN
jgi:hypothetical protein